MGRRFRKVLSILMIAMLVMSLYIPFNKPNDLFAYGGKLVVGKSGKLSADSPLTASSGIADASYEKPPFKISLLRDSNAYLREHLGQTYIFNAMNRGFPVDSSAPIYFVGPEIIEEIGNKPVSIAYANTATKELNYVSDQEALDNMVVMGGSKPTNGVYYEDMVAMGVANFCEDWRSRMNKVDESRGAWSYIFELVGDKYYVDERVDDIFNPERLDYNNIESWNDEQRQIAYTRYLDLLMSLYTLASGRTKETWGQAIDDYINGNNLVENPVAVLFESASFMSFNNREYYLLIPSLDFILFYAGIEKKYAPNDLSWWQDDNKTEFMGEKRPIRLVHPGDSYSQLRLATEKSLALSPDFPRISDRPYSKSNGFSWGASAFTNGVLKTTNGIAQWTDGAREKAKTDYFNIFKLMDPITGEDTTRMFGYMVASNPPKPLGDFKCRLQATPDGRVIEGDTIDVPVTLKVYSDVDRKDYDVWKQTAKVAEENGKQFNVVIRFNRTDGDYPVNIYPNPISYIWSPSELLNFIYNGTTISTVDQIAGTPVNQDDGEIVLNYTVTVDISLDDKTWSGSASDHASFIVRRVPISVEGVVRYTSKPEAYSELKNYGKNSNMRGYLDEDWEAMAGVPSTEQLYFAAGGSEFIVDVTLEYVKNEKAKRSYHSYFNGTYCEFKDGDTPELVTLPMPKGATSYNITVSPHEGGTVYAEWNYTVRNIGNYWVTEEYDPGSPGSPCIGEGYDKGNPGDFDWENKWTADVYNEAIINAKEWQEEVNKVIIKHTAESDRITREWNGWNARLTGDIWGDSISEDEWESYTKTMGSYGYVSGYVKGCGHNCDKEWDREPSDGHGSPGDEDYEPPDPGKRHVHTHRCGTFHPATKTTVTKVSDKSFRVRVEAKVPAHVICGPCCSHWLPNIHDSWAQTWEYDTMKIVDVHVWKIDQAAVDGLEEIIDVDVVGADIVTGEPEIFYNIAAKNDSKYTEEDGVGGATGSSLAGRVRYNVEPEQHDEVIYYNGIRTNKCDGLSHTYSTNVHQSGGRGHDEEWATGFIYNSFKPNSSTTGSVALNTGNFNYPTNTENYLQDHTDDKDKETYEYGTFLRQRQALVRPTMITDFLILQTSHGDQSVMYFDKTSPEAVTSESEIPYMEVTLGEMWYDNYHSASWWDEDHINVGGYNGKYYNPSEKFDWPNGGSTVKTFFEPDPAGTIFKPYGPYNRLMLYEGELNIILENVNKSYKTGKAEVFWANRLHWVDKDSQTFKGIADPLYNAPYSTDRLVGSTGYNFKTNAYYSSDSVKKGGYILDAPYSPEHDKINDIIIHDPVSTEDVAIVSLPDYRDQRTSDTSGFAADIKDTINGSDGCPGDPALCEFRVLNCKFYEDKVVGDFDFDTLDGNGNLINKVTGNSLILEDGFTIGNYSGFSSKVLNAKGTRLSIPFSELEIMYAPSNKIKVEADVKIEKSSQDRMLFSFYMYDIFIPANQEYATINTGESWERKINIPIADGKKHHIEIIFSFNSVDKCRVLVDGKEDYIRINDSKDLSESLIGNSFNIGSWGYNDSYPAGFIVDNLKITRLAGSHYHTEDCYKEMMIHPSGFNVHEHTEECLLSGVDDFIRDVESGRYTNEKLKDMLGDLYDEILNNSVGPLIHTWENWTSDNMHNFKALHNVILTASNGNLVQTATGGDPYFEVPVDIDARGVDKIVVELDNDSSSHISQLFWKSSSDSYYSESKSIVVSMEPNKSNQRLEFMLKGHDKWSGKIDSLRFDIGLNVGTYIIKKIEVYGSGFKEEVEDDLGDVVFEEGRAGAYVYNASAGKYLLEVWGAQGGSGYNWSEGGKGGYSSGKIVLEDEEVLYIYVGGEGGTYLTGNRGGFNGGGNGNGTSGAWGGSGGGATDIRMGGTSLNDRIIVAGGGGGGGHKGMSGYTAGAGGGLSGTAGGGASPGTQTSGYALGIGENSYGHDMGAGGGGYWGGFASKSTDKGGGGGSGYIGGVLEGVTIDGNSVMPNPSGGTMVGKSGNGYARITKLSSGILTIRKGNSLDIGDVIDFEYTGSVQSIPLPEGKYKLEVWGAQGGIGATDRNNKGAYITGELTLDSGEILYIYVGGQGENTGTDRIDRNNNYYSGGFNGGGRGTGSAGPGGGGGTDIRLGGKSIYDRIIVAGGGGGATRDASGSEGRGVTTSNTNGLYSGWNATAGTTSSGYEWDNAGGGGGYYGGAGRTGDDARWSYGGTSYADSILSNIDVKTGKEVMPNPHGGTMVGKSGNGYARITVLESSSNPELLIDKDFLIDNWERIPDKLPDDSHNPVWGCNDEPNKHVCDEYCKVVEVLVCNEPHHRGLHYDQSNPICWDACHNDEAHRKYKRTIKTADGSFEPGNFINIDYGFRLYFPNIGDFYDYEPYGIGSLTSQRGLGFVDNLDTTKWTRVKRVKFEFDVIYDGNLYLAGEWITLGDRGVYLGSDGEKYDETKWSNYGTDLYEGVKKKYYDFYCVLANSEAKAARFDVEVEAVNCPGPNDNKKEPTNKERGKFTALHGGYNLNYIDVVGRIGNLIIEDTGDYRFSNLFKVPILNGSDNKVVVRDKLDVIYPSNGAKRDGNNVVIEGLEGRATTGDVYIEDGYYRVNIYGKALNNGRLRIFGKKDSSTTELDSDKFREVKVDTNLMSYYVEISDYDIVEVVWESINNRKVEVSGIELIKIGDFSDDWIVDGIVREVDESRQNIYLSWVLDIRGLPVGNSTNYLNTWDTLPWANQSRLDLPLSPDKNNIAVLKNEPMLVGYPIYFSIQSIGNYFRNDSSKIQVVPYYYVLDIETEEIIPVDAYFVHDGMYEPVNIHGLVNKDWDGSGVYNFILTLNWLEEYKRRNYTDLERFLTDSIRDMYREDAFKMDEDTAHIENPEENSGFYRQLETPYGNDYILGNGQYISATGRARTFIGGETTYGQLMNLGGLNRILEDEYSRKYNPEGRIDDYLWWQNAQRWHLKLGLPSSTVFIRAGEEISSEAIEEFKSDRYLVLCTADIRVAGDTYILRYEHKEDNGSVTIYNDDGSKKTIKFPNNIPPVIAVYSSTKTSKYDIDIRVVH